MCRLHYCKFHCLPHVFVCAYDVLNNFWCRICCLRHHLLDVRSARVGSSMASSNSRRSSREGPEESLGTCVFWTKIFRWWPLKKKQKMPFLGLHDHKLLNILKCIGWYHDSSKCHHMDQVVPKSTYHISVLKIPISQSLIKHLKHNPGPNWRLGCWYFGQNFGNDSLVLSPASLRAETAWLARWAQKSLASKNSLRTTPEVFKLKFSWDIWAKNRKKWW